MHHDSGGIRPGLLHVELHLHNLSSNSSWCPRRASREAARTIVRWTTSAPSQRTLTSSIRTTTLPSFTPASSADPAEPSGRRISSATTALFSASVSNLIAKPYCGCQSTVQT